MGIRLSQGQPELCLCPELALLGTGCSRLSPVWGCSWQLGEEHALFPSFKLFQEARLSILHIPWVVRAVCLCSAPGSSCSSKPNVFL